MFCILACTLLLTGCGDTPKASVSLAAQGTFSSALDNQSQYAIVGSINHGGSLWRLKDQERLFNWNHKQGEYSQFVACALSPNGSHALTAERKRLVFWNTKTGEAQNFWQINGSATSVSLSRNGLFGLVGQENYNALFLDTAGSSILARLPHGSAVTDVAISDNGRVGITGDDQGYVRIWDLTKPKELHRYKIGNSVATVALSPNGQYGFGAPTYAPGKIWDVATGKLISTVGTHRITLSAARFNHDSSQLLTGDTFRRTVLWSIKAGTQINSWAEYAPGFNPPSGAVINDVAFSPDRKTVTTAYSDGKFTTWSLP